MSKYIAKAGEGDTWVVVNTDTDEVKATHEPPDAQQKAERQAELLNDIDADPRWEEEEKNEGHGRAD